MLSRHAKKVGGAIVLTGAVAIAVVKAVKSGCRKKEEEHAREIQRLKEKYDDAFASELQRLEYEQMDVQAIRQSLKACYDKRFQLEKQQEGTSMAFNEAFKEPVLATQNKIDQMLEEIKETRTALGDLQKVVKTSFEDKDNDNGEPGSYFRAISVQGMRDELVKEAKVENLGDDADIHALLEPVLLKKGKGMMCPRDDRPGTAYVDAILDSNHAGRANVMISYTWEYQLLLIVNTLEEWCDKMKWPRNTTFVWFCCVCINQHRVKEKVDRGEVVSFKKFEQDFGRRVRGIRHILSLLSPWEGPTYITRSWCIYELFTAKETGAKYELLMPKAEEKSFQRALWDSASGSNMKECWQLLEKVRLQDAKATSRDDKQYIDSLVEKGSGFEHLNHTVRQLLKEWFVSNAVNQLQVLQEVKTDVDCTHACAQVGFFLEQMGRTNFVRAIEYYRGGLGMLTETGHHKTLQAVRLLTSIGSIKRRRGEEDGALESFRCAQTVIDVLEPSKDVSDAKAMLCDEIGLVSKVDNAIRRQNFEEAWEIRSDMGTLSTMDGAVLSSHYGRFEAESGALEAAIPRFKQGIEILDKIENGMCTPLGASILSSLANANRKLNMPEAAMQDLKRCCDILDNTESFTTVGAGVWSIRAETEFGLERWDDALKSYEKAREIRDVIRATNSIDGVKMFIGMAKILLKKGEKAKASDNIKEAEQILDRLGCGEKQRAQKEICGKFQEYEREGCQCWEILDAVWPAAPSNPSPLKRGNSSRSALPSSGLPESAGEASPS